jgi:hypothetical protein
VTVLLKFAPILGEDDARIAVSPASVGQRHHRFLME